ncbi:MAG: hypothetical protein MZU79_02900 [Anaerotruncus sp.]|nr:hypothetical protein [Anaerotruncus sp.]
MNPSISRKRCKRWPKLPPPADFDSSPWPLNFSICGQGQYSGENGEGASWSGRSMVPPYEMKVCRQLR